MYVRKLVADVIYVGYVALLVWSGAKNCERVTEPRGGASTGARLDLGRWTSVRSVLRATLSAKPSPARPRPGPGPSSSSAAVLTMLEPPQLRWSDVWKSAGLSPLSRLVSGLLGRRGGWDGSRGKKGERSADERPGGGREVYPVMRCLQAYTREPVWMNVK